MAVSLQAVKIERSEKLGRLLRRDEPSHLGESTWDLLETAIRAGDKAEAIRLLGYLHEGETAPRHYFYFDWMYGNFSYVAQNFGEEAYEKMFRSEVTWGLHDNRLGGFPVEMLTDVEAMVKKQAEIMRGHWPPRGAIVIVEEEDRYVINNFPCNSGGRMLRSGLAEGKWGLAVITKPHPWAWSKPGKPVYCLHCSLGRGIMVSEVRGFPIRVYGPPGEGFNPDKAHPFDPCSMIFYKDPDLMPERYFHALGLKKDPARFKRVIPRSE
ncbi:MAG: hypothetical protein HYU29_05015 [Chloroflexi bacterium]|nr:hypothetical protein [Chloroflexota bacterium]